MKKRASIIVMFLILAAVSAYFTISRSLSKEIRHIVLISIDTCRADYFSCYGYPKNTTPNIDAFAGSATRFENTISPIPITLPAHSSMLTGMIPPAHGVHNNIGFQLAPSNLTLAEILKTNGFDTAAIVSASVMEKQFGLNQGFDLYYDRFKRADYNKNIHGNERKADATTRLALDWLDRKKDGRFFLFLHYYDPHIDYSPPEPYASEFSDNPYAGEIAFTDHCIGQVIEKLKELDLFDSTLIIITGDHGEMLGEHGEDTHAYFIYESAIKVPLLVKLPGQTEAGVMSPPVGIVDLVPTLCSLLEIDIPAQIQGQDISTMLRGEIPAGYERFLYSECGTAQELGASGLMAVSTERWKYIQAPRPELYDIAADPQEQFNLINENQQRARILEDKLLVILENSVRKEQDSQIELDAETIKRLESLGYVAGKSNGEISFNQDQPDPKDYIRVYNEFHRARRLFENKEYAAAKKILYDIIPEHPTYYRIYLVLGDIAMHQQQFDQAILHYRDARMINPAKPNDPLTCNLLAWLQATRPTLMARDVDEAVLLAKRVCSQSNYTDPNLLDTLAVAYAAAGDFANAIETARKAQDMARSVNDTLLSGRIEARLKLFEQSKPYIEE